jgi:hypothetical protein
LSCLPPEDVSRFGGSVPMGRPGQPDEVAPCYVFLAGDDNSYMTGQMLHPDGGRIVNGQSVLFLRDGDDRATFGSPRIVPRTRRGGSAAP